MFMIKKSTLLFALSPILALMFILFGVQKFGGDNPIFTIIAERSGIDVFEPVIRQIVGWSEIIAAALLLFQRTRMTGAVLGLCILIGAIGFHLSPWLGLSVPGGGHGLFITAVIMLILTVINVYLLRGAGEKLIFVK